MLFLLLLFIYYLFDCLCMLGSFLATTVTIWGEGNHPKRQEVKDVFEVFLVSPREGVARESQVPLD